MFPFLTLYILVVFKLVFEIDGLSYYVLITEEKIDDWSFYQGIYTEIIMLI